MTPEQALAVAQSDAALYARTLGKMRLTLLTAVDGAENEVDRVYFGSTMHFDALRDLAHEIDDFHWDKIMESSQPKTDVYAIIAGLRADKASLIAALDESLHALQKLHTDIDALVADSGGVYGLHQNGDASPWAELLTGGRFEDWLGEPLTAAREAWSAGRAAIAKVTGEAS